MLGTKYNVSVKEYNEISKYKDLEIEIEKMWHLKTTTMSVIMSMIKKGADRHTNKILGSSSLYEMLISLGEYYECDRKTNTQKKQQKI